MKKLLALIGLSFSLCSVGHSDTVWLAYQSQLVSLDVITNALPDGSWTNFFLVPWATLDQGHKADSAVQPLTMTNYISGVIAAGINGSNILSATTPISALDQNCSNLIVGAVRISTLNSAINAATNGLVTASVTNGLASSGFVTGQGYVNSSITNGLASTNYVITATNGLVTAAITNGLATISYVMAATAGLVNSTVTNGLVTATITNGLASTAYVSTITNGFVKSSVTNGLVTASITNGLASAVSVVAATNGLASLAYATSVTNGLTPFFAIGTVTYLSAFATPTAALVYTNGTNYLNLGLIPGMAGATGPTGSTGPQGIQGTNATPTQRIRVQTDASGNYTWTYPNAYGSGVTPVVTVSAEGAGTVCMIVQVVSISNTSAVFKVFSLPTQTLLGISVSAPVATQSFIDATAIAP